MIKNLIDLAEQGILPDFLIRSGIRRMQKERILWSKSKTVSEVEKHHQNWVDEMKKSSIAYVPEKANAQHYEVSAEIEPRSMAEPASSLMSISEIGRIGPVPNAPVAGDGSVTREGKARTSPERRTSDDFSPL